MTARTSPPSQPRSESLNRDGVKRIITVFSILILLGALLFGSAGRLNWIWAWIYLGLYAGVLVINAVLVLRFNPEVANERGRSPQNQEGWDKRIMRLYTPLGLAAMILAGLDAGRFGWSNMPLWLQLAGLPLSLCAYAITIWTMLHNKFLSQKVAIQKERGHTVATTGPYSYIRHPMYTSLMLSWVATPLILGSWWMFVPAGLSILLFIIRTVLEDRALHQKLDGYQAYAQHVTYRLLPGLW